MNNDRMKTEALALRYVLNLAGDERAEAAERLERKTLALLGLAEGVRKTLDAQPNAPALDLLTILDREGLKEEKADLAAAGALVLLTEGQDPAKLKEAYLDALAGADELAEKTRLDEARLLLGDAANTSEPAERAKLKTEALDRLEKPLTQLQDKPLADLWEEHRLTLVAEEATEREGLKLDPVRGAWADWVNAYLGPRAALMPGKALLLGAASGGGKTTFAGVVAVDAMAAGCPVTFHQLELSTGASLEYLFNQYPPKDAWRKTATERTARPLPPSWADLLTIPRDASPNGADIAEAVKQTARRAERLRRRDPGRAHACNGLFILDYAQLLTRESSAEARHEALEKGCSAIVKAAANSGACVLLLSQVNKADQKEKGLTQTAFAGADLARMVDAAFTLEKAAEDKEGELKATVKDVLFTPGKGEARLLKMHKNRGHRTPPNGSLGFDCPLWMMDGCLHDGNNEPKTNNWRPEV